MPRQPKKALDYFPKDVNYYDDDRIADLLDEFGPIGQTIYDVILCIVYKNGYYLELPLDKLARIVVRYIGNRWIKSKDIVLQVIHYCAEIGLFDIDLLRQNVITSAGIQKRYSEVTARNKVNKDNYWLLKKENASTALISAPEISISATETSISATETSIADATMQQRKEKESKVKESKVKCVEGDALTYGTHNNIHLTAEQYDALCKDYGKPVTDDYIERCGDYVANSGKKPYSNHYQTLLNWLTKDGVEKQKQHSYDVDKILAHAKANVSKL